jgi:flagellar biosynthetic protein FliQ
MMDADTVISVGRQAMWVTMLLAAPILLASLAVGLIIAMFQAATQINEMTLSFVPKLMVVAMVMVVAGPWMLKQITGFMLQLAENIPYLIG